MRIEIKHRCTGEILFAHKCENNTVALTLREAVVSGADLRRADLCDANLCDANLCRANLWGTIGNSREVKSVQVSKYAVTWADEVVQIGCQNHTKEEWLDFSNREIADMDTGALTWWEEWKPKLITLGVFGGVES
jgi:hypothetical protein